MNWAKIIVSTVREKARREGVKVMKSGGGTSLDFNGGEASIGVDCDILFKSFLVTKLEKVEPTEVMCPFGIFVIDITHVVEMHSLLEN